MIKFYLAFFTSLITFSSFAQTTVTFTPQKDNTMYQNATSNSDGQGGYLYAGVTNSASPRRALVKFDLSSIPAGSVIISATLTLNLVKTRAGDIPISLYRVTQDWGEGNSNSGSGVDGGGSGTLAATGDATWSHRIYPGTTWSTQGGTFSASASATTNVGSATGPYTWTGMTSDVQAWVNSAATNFGWLIKSNEAGSFNTKKFSSRNNATTSERPSLEVVYTSATPVTLAFLKAAEVKEGVLVTWQTQAEFNNSFFLIEHSTDGISFSGIGKVMGAGNSNSPKNYSLVHQAILPEKHYYRLAQTDINGQVKYSQVVLVNVKSKHNVIVISPNPVDEILNVKGVTANPGMTYNIISSTGAKVAAGKFNSAQINVSNLAQGFYTLIITDGEENFNGRFMIK